ncbi:major facilitator superfamily domain-containing protein [Pisolithus microcarpus]|nr:major facilitator superfamily domain-containing protein [Pisolithus microcarpus]
MDDEGNFTFANKARIPTTKAMEDGRSKTFGQDWWPHDDEPNHGANSKKMARAGFVYTPQGAGDDTVTCLYCNLALGGWDKDDDPIHERRKRATKSGSACPFFSFAQPTAPAKLTRSESIKAGEKSTTTLQKRSRTHSRTRSREEDKAMKGDLMVDEEPRKSPSVLPDPPVEMEDDDPEPPVPSPEPKLKPELARASTPTVSVTSPALPLPATTLPVPDAKVQVPMIVEDSVFYTTPTPILPPSEVLIDGKRDSDIGRKARWGRKLEGLGWGVRGKKRIARNGKRGEYRDLYNFRRPLHDNATFLCEQSVPPSISHSELTRSLAVMVSLSFQMEGYTNGVIGAILMRDYPESTAFYMLACGCRSNRQHKMMFAAFYIIFFSAVAGIWSSCGWGDMAWLVRGLCCLRFLLGIGVGLGNPPVIVSVSEQTEKEGIPENAQNWWSVLFTNTKVDTGFVISVLIPFLLCCVIDENYLNMVWGTSIFLGAILASLWCQSLEWDHSWDGVRLPYRLALKKYWKSLLGLSLAWFIYDFITGPMLMRDCQLVIYSSVIMNTVTGGSSSLIIVFGWTLVINLFFLPGSVLGAFLVDEHGLKNLMAIVGLGIGAVRDAVANHIAAYAIAYGVFLSLGEFGPGNCIGVLAAKTAPLAVRELFYGVAAASGKVGAFIGVWVFPQIINAFGGSNTAEGITAPFCIGGGLAAVCALVTFCLVKPIVHNGMKAEDKAFHQYLEENGFDVSLIGAHRNEV